MKNTHTQMIGKISLSLFVCVFKISRPARIFAMELAMAAAAAIGDDDDDDDEEICA